MHMPDPLHVRPGGGEQSVPEGAKTFAGHEAPEPVQFSAGSHTPFAARHSVVAAANPSAGHVALVPVQFSATSHTPADVRHTVDAGA